MHNIFLVERVPYCGSLVHGSALNFGSNCWWEFSEPDCFDYVPRETEYDGVPVICSPCKRIMWKTIIISKQYKQFEYDDSVGITLGKTLHPIDRIRTLIIDSQYYVGEPEAESGE